MTSRTRDNIIAVIVLTMLGLGIAVFIDYQHRHSQAACEKINTDRLMHGDPANPPHLIDC